MRKERKERERKKRERKRMKENEREKEKKRKTFPERKGDSTLNFPVENSNKIER